MHRDLVTLLYVSTSTIAPSQADGVIRDIVGQSQTANRIAHITGAMVYTETRFAQVLEGPSAAVDRLITRIQKDRRHRDLLILNRHPIIRRTFGQWNMAYAGPSQLIANAVAKPIYNAMRGIQPDAETIAALMATLHFGKGA